MAIAVSAGRSKSERRVMRYEDRLASLFEEGEVSLTLMALAHIGGFAGRLPDWLAACQQKYPDAAKVRQRIFDALLTGDIATIEGALREPDIGNLSISLRMDLEKSSPSKPDWLDKTLLLVVDPLILLGRADLVARLHANSVQRLGTDAASELTMPAVRSLAEADEWDQCLDVIKRAPQSWLVVDVYLAFERLIWKQAYHHGRVDSVLPVLAEVPFSRPMSREAEARPWRLKAYQIRAGASVTIPVIEGEQPAGYTEAAAMQIAALAHDPASAEIVQNLRRVLRPAIGQIIDVDRGIAFSHSDLPGDFSTAEAQIAARRRDYARAAELARTPSQNVLTDPPMVVIDALLVEGDWRAAAEIAKAHDPRRKKLIPGFDDTRAEDYVSLYKHLALAAARAGDDDAAAAFLADSRTVERTEVRRGDADAGARTDARFFWPETLFAGAAEGRLPRKYLDLLIPVFPLAL
jgi:hypothetical protein